MKPTIVDAGGVVRSFCDDAEKWLDTIQLDMASFLPAGILLEK